MDCGALGFVHWLGMAARGGKPIDGFLRVIVRIRRKLRQKRRLRSSFPCGSPYPKPARQAGHSRSSPSAAKSSMAPSIASGRDQGMK